MRVENILENAAMNFGNKVGFIVGSRRMTFGETNALANQFANALLEEGLEREERVIVFLDSSIESIVSVFGTLKASGVYSIVNSGTKAAKVAFIVNDLGPKVIVTQKRLLSVVREALEHSNSVTCVLVTDSDGPFEDARFRSLSKTIQAQSSAKPVSKGIDVDLAYVIYTSGSTGFPKGVMMTHQSSVMGASSIIEYVGNTHDDIILSVIPMSFDYGMYQVIMTAKFGGTLILENSFAFPKQILKKMGEEKVTGFPLVPTIASIVVGLKGLVPGSLPHVKYITNTAAPLPPAHSKRLQELFPTAKIFSNYGLSETIRSTYLPPDQLASRPTSVGKAMPNTEAYVVDDNNNRVGPNVVGELVLRGANLMRGYWNNSTATDQMLKPGKYPWEKVLYTGDLFKTDEDGFLYYIGRKDDMLKSRGEKVSPREVENVLYSLAGIREAAVIGVPDPVQGMAIRAVLSLMEGTTLTEQAVQAHCAKYLEDYMVPSSVEFRSELPKTESGKIRRRELQDEAAKLVAQNSKEQS